jgi:hypothetical protein
MLTKDEEATELARKHYEIEAGLTRIFRLTGSGEAEFRPNEPIKLPSGIMPIQFGPSPASGLNFSSIIVEVTPEEFQKIQDQQLALPHGWKVGDPIPRPPLEEGW